MIKQMENKMNGHIWHRNDVDKLGFFDLFNLIDIPKQTSSDCLCTSLMLLFIYKSFFIIIMFLAYNYRGILLQSSHIFLARLGTREDGEGALRM